MSTIEYEETENLYALDSEVGEFKSCPMIQPIESNSHCCDDTDNELHQPNIYDRPETPSSGPQTPAAKQSKPDLPQQEQQEQREFKISFDLPPQYATECDLEATKAPSELLPHIESTTTCAKIEPAPPSESIKETEPKNEAPKTKKTIIPVKNRARSAIPKKTEPAPSTSAIPVKISKPSSRLSINPSKTGSLCRSQLRTPKATINKHTLEVQFINKHKRLVQFKKDLVEKQRPIMDLYQNLLEIKKQLAEFGKIVDIEEIRLVSMEEPKKKSDNPCGDVVNLEIIENMKSSIEDIPKALLGACKNLVGRRDAIVELLESVSQADIEPAELADKIGTLKDEGKELKTSLDVLITQSEERIHELVRNWYTLLDHNNQETKNVKLDEYENQIRQKDAILQEYKQLIVDLQKKIEDKRNLHEKAITEFEISVKKYTDDIKKLTHDLEVERRSNSEIKTRNAGNGQTIRNLKQKLTEAEAKLKDSENKNTDLSKKLRTAQEQHRQKETNWSKEKDELQKNVKEQEKLLGKLSDDRKSFQTSLEMSQKSKRTEEENMMKEIDDLRTKVKDLTDLLEESQKEKIEITEKYDNLEKELERLGRENEKNIDTISKQMDWGKSVPCTDAQAELYSELLATKVTLREFEDKIKNLEKENSKLHTERKELMDKMGNMHMTPDIRRQEEIINRYKNLLQESEMRLNERSVEVAKLNAELKHLKIRQDALEEQNSNCPTDELRKMVTDGRQKLSEIMKKSIENEQKIACYESTIEKQHKQMNEMENLLRVRDGLIGMIKAKKDELLMEKDSLTRYCKDVRNMLAETREDLRVKSEIIRDLQEKLDKKEKNCVILEKKIRELEENLAYTNEKRFKLQDTIGSMEKELQSTKGHVNHVEKHQSRYDLVPDLNSSNPPEGPVKIKIMLS